MSFRLVALLVALSAVPSFGAAAAPKKKDPAEAAYQQARRGYYALKDDAARRKFRHHWLAAIDRFQDVARKYPRSPRAADALFTSAELLSDLSRVSLVDSDLKAAAAAYGRVVDDHAKSSLADDAALAMAKLYSDRLGQPELAVKVLEKGAALGRGDRAREIAALHAALTPGKGALRFGPPEPVKKTAVAVAKPAAKKERVPEKTASPPVKAPEPPAASIASAETKAVSPQTAHVAAERRGGVEAASQEAGAGHSSADAAGGRAVAAAAVAAEPAGAGTADSQSEALSAAFERALSRGADPESGAADPVDAPEVSTGTGSVVASGAPATGSGSSGASQPVAVSQAAVAAQSGLGTPPGGSAGVAAPSVSASSHGSVAGTAVPAEKKGEATARLPKVPAHRPDASVTLAEQLGLKIRRVVIDPGHGGHDSGAIGRKGTQEKDVALEVSKQVAELLRAEGLEVSLTRDDDRFIRLEDRAKFANEAKADLFISIHCNSAPNRKTRGIETYTLNTSADRYSIRLAARENASSERGVSDLQFILADLATKANTEESTRLANRVQANLVKHLSAKYTGIKDLGTKEALFYVLLGVRMPAILIETSFLSHPEEEKRLGSKGYQREMARSIAAGVQDFLDHRGRLAQVN